MKNFRLAAGLCVIALIVPLYFNARNSEAERIEQDVRNIGASAAYERLVLREAGRPNNEQHRLGHLFGDVLYRVKGLQGIDVCDDRLLAGCYHEFIGRAISDKGMAVVRQLNSICESHELPHGVACEHGIGHGLVAHLGYELPDLKAALGECATLAAQDRTKGCNGGALMEFNLRTMLGDGKALVFSENKISGICEALVPSQRPDCFFWLPQWWSVSKRMTDKSELFSKLGDLCASSASDESERTACFTGIGYIAPPAVEFDSQKSRELCAVAAKNDSDKRHCLEEAASSRGEVLIEE